MRLEDIVIVLARPSEAGNVGAVCRSMKNMGLSRLRLAAPALDNWAVAGLKLTEAGLDYGGNEAVIRARAVHAVEIWEQAETFAALAEAVADCSLVIGTTRRRGRRRKQVTMNPSEAAAFIKQHQGTAALVFGNERTGLEDDEMELCNFASHIPADDSFPSLNLSHAVTIYAYELFRLLGPIETEAVKGQWVPLDQKKIENVVEEIMGSLKILGFYKLQGREEQQKFFRDIFSRSGITERESRYFSGIIAKAVRLAQNKADKQ